MKPIQEQKIYVAVSLETGELMSGAKGQHAYGSIQSLTKSIGQDYWTRKKAKEQGVRPRDLYKIIELDVLQSIAFAGREIQ